MGISYGFLAKEWEHKNPRNFSPHEIFPLAIINICSYQSYYVILVQWGHVNKSQPTIISP